MASIPERHLKYGVLPLCRKSGGEVFSYPAELSFIDDMLGNAIDGSRNDRGERVSLITPYGFNSQEDYLSVLERYAGQVKYSHPTLTVDLRGLEQSIIALNDKDAWSVVRYVGEASEDIELTPGKCYYWPCCEECPRFEGVIDDEEFTSYMYSPDPSSWEVIDDPTGMAARVIEGYRSRRLLPFREEPVMYLPLYFAAKLALDQADPYGLLEGGAPRDEFEGEARSLAARIGRHLNQGEVRVEIRNVLRESMSLELSDGDAVRIEQGIEDRLHLFGDED